MDLHPIQPVEFDQAWNTGQIGLKFTEITLYASLVELGIISMNSTGIYLNGFTPNLTGRIWPVGRIWLVGQIWPDSRIRPGGWILLVGRIWPVGRIWLGINLKWSSEEFPVKNFQSK